MASVRQGSWWEVFVRRLARESVTALAPEFDSSIAELEKALSLADAGGSALDAPWWPEAVRRIQAGVSLRDTARSFGTNPRRLRRALARAGIRVGGANLGASGLPALAAFRDRLGREPDTAIAAEAGVSTLAVQGERRRLALSAFRPKGRVRQSPPPPAAPPRREAPAPARPLRPRGRFSGPDAPPPADLQIIRRPGSARGGRSVPTAQVPAADAPAPATHSAGHLGGLPVLAPAPARLAVAPPPDRPRRRIVRPDRPESAELAEPVPTRRAPRRAEPRHGAVRLMAPSPETQLHPLEDALPAPLFVDPLDVDRIHVEPAVAAPEAAPPVAPAAGAPARRVGVPAQRRAPASPAPAPASETTPPVVLAPAAPRAAEPVPSAAWRVSIGGAVQPFVIVAPDMRRAMELLADRLPADQLPQASLWQAGALI